MVQFCCLGPFSGGGDSGHSGTLISLLQDSVEHATWNRELISSLSWNHLLVVLLPVLLLLVRRSPR